jgi:hypothetical protein
MNKLYKYHPYIQIKAKLQYLITSFLFYIAFVSFGVFNLFIFLFIAALSYLISLVFAGQNMSLLLVVSWLVINLAYIKLQQLNLEQQIKIKQSLGNVRAVLPQSDFKLQILDLDGSITNEQHSLLQEANYNIIDLQKWETKLRLLCSFSTFSKFEQELNLKFNKEQYSVPSITFLGSNDFDHITLILLRQITTPFNLLFFDQHADWNPFFLTDMMCGSWLYHAFTTTKMLKVFHVGGSEKAFDATGNIFDAVECFGNGRGIQKYLDDGRVICLPATRKFAENPYINYDNTINQPLKIAGKLSKKRLLSLLEQHREELARFPLFIAIDKDVLTAQDNIQSWGAGELLIEDVETIISSFMQLSNYQIIGVSICGDYSQSKYSSPLHWGNLIEKITFFHGVRSTISHSSLHLNEKTNKRLVSLFQSKTAYGESL